MTAEAIPEGPKIPKSFVIRASEMTKSATQLVHDLRRVMEPNTATRLREQKSNKLKDYMSVAGPLGVTHFMLLTQTEETLNLRLAKFPQGPTLYFRIHGFTLQKDIQTCSNRPHSFLHEFDTAPLLVLNNFNNTTSVEGKLVCTMLQSMFPTVNTAKVRLADIRRVVLCHYNREEDMVEFRHYAIGVKMVGVSKTVKRILKADIPDLSHYDDISEYIMREAAGSDSEFEEDSVVTLGQDYVGKLNKKSSKRAVNLIEIGPRIKMQLIKILDGFCVGKTLYHIEGKKKPETGDGKDGKKKSKNKTVVINPIKKNNQNNNKNNKKKWAKKPKTGASGAKVIKARRPRIDRKSS
jgi:ribosome biogenesis protein SSF1/2